VPGELHRRRTVSAQWTRRQARCRPVERILWDDELAGFGLRIQPTGHKTWIVKYEQHGRQINVTSVWSATLAAEAARGQARALLARWPRRAPRPAVQRTAPTFEAYVEPFWATTPGTGSR